MRSYFASCNDAPADRLWVDVRERSGARWDVSAPLTASTAVSVERNMHGRRRGRPFTAHGAYRFSVRRGRITEIRQYWALDSAGADTGLVGHPTRGGSLPR